MPTIIVKQGIAAERPTLKVGEPALSTDTREVHIGTSAGNIEILTQESPEDAAHKVSQTKDGFMSKEDKKKLDGIATGANAYTHPSTHPASMITEAANKRFMTDAERTKLGGIATSAEVNQNAFSNVKVGSTTVAADTKTDTLELVAGSNVTITPDATNDKITIAATNTVYTHPSTHPASMITEEANKKFMTDAERTKLGGIATGANNYVHPSTHPASIIAQDTNNRFMTDAERNKLAGISIGAESNQNAFGNVKVGSVTIAADTKTDVLELVAGTNVTLTADDVNDKVTITSKDTVYTHPNDANTRHVTDTEKTTWNAKASTAVVTTTANGLMSKEDKVKLNGVATGANNYTHPSTHPASIIVQDANNRFVTDVQKTAWDGKETTSGAQTKATKALTDAKAYTDTKVAGLVNSAPETLDTLKELSDALGNDPNFATTVATQIGTKVDKVSGKGLSTNDYTTAEKTKLTGIATGAEVNQNAFSNVKVGSTTIAADAKTDVLELVAGANVTLTPDATNDKVTIAATNTVYTHPNDANTRHVTDAEKTTWNAKASTAVVTTAANGLMTKEDKTKLNGVAAGANNYTHPSTHPASMITGLPTSLPANGGNADTVDGKHASDFAPTSHLHKSIGVNDIRDTAPTPDEISNNSIVSFFNNHASYGGDWHSGFSVKGWSAGYDVWQMKGYAANGTRSNRWSLRSGSANTWGNWFDIYHTGFKPTPADIGAVKQGIESINGDTSFRAIRIGGIADPYKNAYLYPDTDGAFCIASIVGNTTNYYRFSGNDLVIGGTGIVAQHNNLKASISNITISTAGPSGGKNKDVWYQI